MILIASTLITLISCSTTESSEREELRSERGFDNVFVDPEPKELSEAELKMQLRDKECVDPVSYIQGTMQNEARFKNALSLKVTGVKLKYSLSSSAAIATFKDIKTKVTLTAKTGGVVKEEIVTIHEYLTAGSSKIYKTEIPITNQQWKETTGINWEILGATCH